MRKRNLMILWLAALTAGACHFESFDERCARETREYTQKQCPRRLDEHTIMDSTVYDTDTRTITYYYTFVGELDNVSQPTEEITRLLHEQLRKNVVNSVELKAYKEKGLSFCYRYRSQSTGKELFNVLIGPEDYGTGERPKTEE